MAEMASRTGTLTHTQLGVLTELLRKDFRELMDEIEEELEGSEYEGYLDRMKDGQELADQSVVNMLYDIELADVDRHIDEVRDVEAALLRLKAGHYGICIECGDPIGYERLHAYPIAKRCYACQLDHERRKLAQG
jgi:RNA polymerase-binding protein DksA